jgi:hypothetical protein
VRRQFLRLEILRRNAIENALACDFLQVFQESKEGQSAGCFFVSRRVETFEERVQKRAKIINRFAILEETKAPK